MQEQTRLSAATRLLWFAGLWLAGVGALGAVVWLLKALMHAAGMR